MIPSTSPERNCAMSFFVTFRISPSIQMGSGMVHLERFKNRRVIFICYRYIKPCSLKSEVQTAAAAEQADHIHLICLIRFLLLRFPVIQKKRENVTSSAFVWHPRDDSNVRPFA